MYFAWGMLMLYSVARICLLYADRIPTLVIVLLHVVPPALFAVAHGAALYRAKGIAVFCGLCLGIGSVAESLSLRTGFPFGNYYFTDVMGPKVLQLPVLLALAYLGIGYVSWVLALLILGRVRLVVLPLLATVIMVSWDIAMDPAWATLYRAWVWREGGAWFGVPVSNFVGWSFTAYLYYQAFALYCRRTGLTAVARRQSFWTPAILLYAVCALGNALLVRFPMARAVVADPTGKQWLTADVLRACVSVSLLAMLPFAILAWRRLPRALPLDNVIADGVAHQVRHGTQT
jgi:uncharacterized membrane protein